MMAGKAWEGECIEKGCKRQRVTPTWYCRDHQRNEKKYRERERDPMSTGHDDLDRAMRYEERGMSKPRPDDACACGHSYAAHYRDKNGVRCNGVSCNCRGFRGREKALDMKPIDTRPIEWKGEQRNFKEQLGDWAGETYRAIGGAGAKLSVKPLCSHRGERVCLTLSDGKELAGAQGGRLNESGAAHGFDLIIDCAGMVQGSRFVAKSTNPRFRTLNQLAFPDVLRLQWPDMTAPSHVGIRFWQRLRDMLPGKTCVCCVGGHGRTGTCLACLLVADGMDADEAISKVRKEHCERAIETPAQEQYVRELAKQRDAGKGKGEGV